MLVQDDKQQSAKDAPNPKPAAKLYSIFALQRDKAFTGEFETSKGNHKFSFAPATAKIVNGKLQFTGTFSLGARKVPNVTATMVSMQSGVGNVPGKIAARPTAVKSGLPVTECTDEHGFVGALYLQLSPIKSALLGLSIDMSKVQLNARLFPTSQVERDLQTAISDVVASYEQINALSELNKIFRD